MNAQSHAPLYKRVEHALAGEISSGRLADEARLPAEDELMARFAVSRTTVRSAVQELLRRGLVEIRRGKGTFVARPRIVQELTGLTGFTEDMAAAGLLATARVLDAAVVAADRRVAERLALEAGGDVVRIRRVRLADGEAVSLDETFLPVDPGRRIMEEDLEHEPIFPLLEGKYQIPLVEADHVLAAIAAGTFEADALGIAAGAPIFLIERTSFTDGRRPIDYERLYYRGDSIRFSTRLSRRAAGPRP